MQIIRTVIIEKKTDMMVLEVVKLFWENDRNDKSRV